MAKDFTRGKFLLSARERSKAEWNSEKITRIISKGTIPSFVVMLQEGRTEGVSGTVHEPKK